MASLPALANGCDEAAATLAAAAYRVRCAGPSYEDFGAGGRGRLGELGVHLHDLWLTAVEARATEAAGVAGQLADVAVGLRTAVAGYVDVDRAAHRRFVREP
jgi:hypothetical protein